MTELASCHSMNDLALGKKLFFVAIMCLVAGVFFVLCYELLATIGYYRWKRSFPPESAMSMVTVRSSNPRLIWEYRPHGEHQLLKFNRHGFRDVERATDEKAPGDYRVLFLGDSVTVGLKMEFEKIFPRQFAALLGRDDVEVFNVAVDGYDVRQIAELLRARALGFAPDRVYYVICLNDFDFEDTSSLKTRYFIKPKSFLLEKLRKLPRKFREWSGEDFLESFFALNRAAFFAEILAMHQACAERGVEFEAVIVPAFTGRGAAGAYAYANIHREIAAVLAEHGIACMDLLDGLSQATDDLDGLAIDFWHLNERGHRLVAEILAERFAAAVPRSDPTAEVVP